MTTIRIAEAGPDRADVELGSYRYSANLPLIFSDQEEAELDWYFEEWLRFPFTDPARAASAADSITNYGHALFGQLFASPDAYSTYDRMQREFGIETIRFEIIGSPAFHSRHWEALKDPRFPKPFVLLAPMVRKNTVQPAVDARPNASATFNLLVVTARPDEGRDVGYRTITRPLIEGLRQASLKVVVDLVRPGTWGALLAQLREKKPGFYHAVHFDLHGTLRRGTGTAAERLSFDTASYETDPNVPFLAFEGEDGGRDARSVKDLAELLILHRIPLVVLNACQSGKQIGVTETSLAAGLMKSGVKMVVAMRWSITVTAAKKMIPTFYSKIFDGYSAEDAVTYAR